VLRGLVARRPASLNERGRVERKRLGWPRCVRPVSWPRPGSSPLDTMIERLKDNHVRARQLAELFAAAFSRAHYDPSSVKHIVSSIILKRARSSRSLPNSV